MNTLYISFFITKITISLVSDLNKLARFLLEGKSIIK